jgi:hypothetical protein
MSETQSRTLGAELGVGPVEVLANLSAKLTATFGTNFTVTSETTITDTYRFEVPERIITISTLWQLVDEVVIVDAAGAELDYEGQLNLGFVSIPARWVISRATQATPAYALDAVQFDAA